jgi:hypothetical protein
MFKAFTFENKEATPTISLFWSIKTPFHYTSWSQLEQSLFHYIPITQWNGIIFYAAFLCILVSLHFHDKSHLLCKQYLHNFQFMKKVSPHQTIPS